MEVLKEIKVARQAIMDCQAKQQSIGLVPTMGALHHGHLSLIEQSLIDNDVTIVSVFVNPIQFNNAEDFAKYPSTLEDDLQVLDNTGCDFVFAPNRLEMYPSNPTLNFSFGHLDTIMEGAHRPGHFNGVAIIVEKLFNILTPRRAYFGQKDIQQFKVIETVLRDLSQPIELVRMPIVRDETGLALSSRNQRLSVDGKRVAAEIYKALTLAREKMLNGVEMKVAVAAAKHHLSRYNQITIEYLELVKEEDLTPVLSFPDSNPLVLCFAGYLEGVRLIDNIIIEQKRE